jgi:hypothetical protein
MDLGEDSLSKIDTEIERLRQQRPAYEANAKCAEIDTAITGLQWLRQKYTNAMGERAIFGIGGRGERVDVEAMREGWKKYKMYRAVPDGPQQMLHLLARGAQFAESHEDAKALLARLIEVLEFVWPTSTVQEHTAATVGKIVVLVPKEAGLPLRQGFEGMR